MIRTRLGALLLAGLSLAGAAGAAPLPDASSGYRFVKLDYPGAKLSTPLGINDKGQVVGYFIDRNDFDHGYLWQDGKFTALPDYPGSAGTGTGGINNKGHISGTWFDKAGFQHGFLLAPPASCAAQGPAKCPPVFTSIDDPDAVRSTNVPFEFGPGLGTAGLGLNDDDEVVGLFCTAGLWSDGFVYSAGGYQSIDNPYATHARAYGTKLFGINDKGVVAGNYLARDGHVPITHAFLLRKGTYISLDIANSAKGGFGTQVNSVANTDLAGGVFTTAKGAFRGFIWRNGQVSVISFPGMPYTEVNGINRNGDLTGDYATDAGGTFLRGYVAFRKTAAAR